MPYYSIYLLGPFIRDVVLQNLKEGLPKRASERGLFPGTRFRAYQHVRRFHAAASAQLGPLATFFSGCGAPACLQLLIFRGGVCMRRPWSQMGWLCTYIGTPQLCKDPQKRLLLDSCQNSPNTTFGWPQAGAKAGGTILQDLIMSIGVHSLTTV